MRIKWCLYAWKSVNNKKEARFDLARKRFKKLTILGPSDSLDRCSQEKCVTKSWKEKIWRKKWTVPDPNPHYLSNVVEPVLWRCYKGPYWLTLWSYWYSLIMWLLIEVTQTTSYFSAHGQPMLQTYWSCRRWHEMYSKKIMIWNILPWLNLILTDLISGEHDFHWLNMKVKAEDGGAPAPTAKVSQFLVMCLGSRLDL